MQYEMKQTEKADFKLIKDRNMNVFDVIIIGFGKGGKTLAAEFAKRGQKVAIIERSEKCMVAHVLISDVSRQRR